MGPSQSGARAGGSRWRHVVAWSGAVGIVTGLVVAAFERLVIDLLNHHVFELPLGALAVMPFVGLVLAALTRRYLAFGASPASADEYLEAYHDEAHPIAPREVVGKMTAALATLGFGGAMGLEGPSIYVGAALGSAVQRRFEASFGGVDRRLLLVAGAAAGVAAIFKAPATGAIFAIEVPYQDDLARRMLLPSLVAAATGYLGFVAVNGTAPLFAARGTPPFSLLDLGAAAAIGVTAGLGARVFARLLSVAKRLATGRRRVASIIGAGALLASLFAIGRALTGRSLVLGPGYSAIQWAAEPGHSIPLLLAVLVLRCLATAATVAGGGVGGLFVPLVVAGALLGRATSAAVGDDTTLFLVIGVAAFLGAGYRVPLAAVMFVAETTGRPGYVVPGLIAAVAAELVMGRASVTEYQRAAPI